MDDFSHTHKRVSDDEIAGLIVKVDKLEQQFQELRKEFESSLVANETSHAALNKIFAQVHDKLDSLAVELKTHTGIEEDRMDYYNKEMLEIKQTLNVIKATLSQYNTTMEKVFTALDDIRKEVKEPVQAFNNAKSGLSFVKWLSETCKNLAYFGTGVAALTWVMHQLKILG